GPRVAPALLGTLRRDLIANGVPHGFDIVQVAFTALTNLTLFAASLTDQNHGADRNGSDQREKRGHGHDRTVALSDGHGHRPAAPHDRHHHHARARHRRRRRALGRRRRDCERRRRRGRRRDAGRTFHQRGGHALP